MKLINLSGKHGKGLTTKVDDDIYKQYGSLKWHYAMGMYNNHYVSRRFGKKVVRLHRIVNKTPTGMFTDHINGDTLDNRRINLRTCTKLENQFNSKAHKDKKKLNGVSIPKGIIYDKNRPNKPWRGRIKQNSKIIYTKSFKSMNDAIDAYNSMVVFYRGGFARTD